MIGSIRAADIPLINQTFSADGGHQALCNGKPRDKRGGKPGDRQPEPPQVVRKF
jgi:hypothetical protein